MEVKTEYPWNLVSISEIAFVTDFSANGSFADLRENVKYKSQPDYAILVRLVDFSNDWQNEFVYVPKHSYDFLKKSKLEVGDVIISNIGAHAGTLFRVPDLGKPITLGPNALVIKTNDFPNTSRSFIYYYLTSKDGQRKIQDIISSTAQPKFNKTDFRALQIPIPTLTEQEAIAETLSDADTLIEALEGLIAKKRQVKQGAMQELLTGKKRLVESGKWEVVTLGDIAEIKMCKRIFAEQTSINGDIPFYKIGTFGKKPDAYISEDLYQEYKSNYSFPRKGDILLSAAGTLGRTVVYDGEASYYQDSNIVWLDVDKNRISNKYLFHYYNTFAKTEIKK